MTHRRFLFLLACLLSAHAAHASEQDDLAALRQRIANLQQELEKTSASHSEAADGLRESERAISDSNRRLHQLALRQQEASREWRQLMTRESALRHKLATQQTTLGRLLYQQYRNGGEQGYLRLLLNNDDPSQAARELRYYGYLMRARAAALMQLRDHLRTLHALSLQARAKQDEISALQTEERAQRQRLGHERKIRRQMMQRIAVQLKRQQREIERLQKNEQRLSQLVGRLGQLLPGTPPIAFRTLKGHLPLPVHGTLVNRYGTRRPDSPLKWTGWLLRAPAQQPVRAIAAGRVVYADWLRGYGNLLIIDHGGGYMSLYGHNETLYKQAGDTLHAQDIIATVGNSGGHEHSGLYFEIRFQGKPLDPAPWIRRR